MIPPLQDSEEIVRLGDFIDNRIEPKAAASIFPGLGCGFFSVNHNIPSISGTCAVMIAPALCAYNARLALSRWERSSLGLANNLVFLLYEEEDLIHGAAEKIRQALIRIVNDRKPRALFVVTSCLPEIVGEDLSAVVSQVQADVPCPVLLIKTENFTDMTARTSQVNALLSFSGIIKDTADRKPHTVNIFGSNARDFAASELSQVLHDAGFSINAVFPSRCDVSLFETAASAGYNILLTRNAQALAGWMEEEFSIPFFLFDTVYTPEAICEKYHGLGDFFGVDLLPFTAGRHKKLLDEIDAARRNLQGKSAIVSYSNGRVFDLALLLKECGIHIPVIGMNHVTDDDYSDARKLGSKDEGILLVRSMSHYPLDDCIASIRPDYFIAFGGPDATFCARHGVRSRALVMRPHPNGFDAARRIISLVQEDKPGLSTLLLREQILVMAGIA